MGNGLTILYIDVILYIITSIYWIKKKKWNVGIMILLIMTISHIGAIFYYSILSFLGLLVADIELEPFLYLYICILICIYPFLRYDHIWHIDVRGNKSFIKYLSIFIFLITIEPFFENIKILLTHRADFNDVYEASRDGDVSITEYIGFSIIGEKLNAWSALFRVPAFVLFFYYLSQKRFAMSIVMGIVVLHYFLFGISVGQRGQIVIYGMACMSCFILMMNLYPKRILRKILRWSLILFVPFVLLFSAITISRYDSKSSHKMSLEQWLLLYVSEGPIRFNSEMYYGEHNTNGDVNLCYLKSLLGMKTYTTYEERDQHYLAKNGRRVEVFYTFIGDFVSDYGLTYTVLLCCILSIIVIKILSRKRGDIPIHKFMFILFLCHMYCIGFASNVYRSYGFQRGIFILLLICFIMHVNRQMFLNNQCKSK